MCMSMCSCMHYVCACMHVCICDYICMKLSLANVKKCNTLHYNTTYLYYCIKHILPCPHKHNIHNDGDMYKFLLGRIHIFKREGLKKRKKSMTVSSEWMVYTLLFKWLFRHYTLITVEVYMLKNWIALVMKEHLYRTVWHFGGCILYPDSSSLNSEEDGGPHQRIQRLK